MYKGQWIHSLLYFKFVELTLIYCLMWALVSCNYSLPLWEGWGGVCKGTENYLTQNTNPQTLAITGVPADCAIT